MSEKQFLFEVLKADPEHYDAEVVYKFSNDREFLNTDRGNSGIFGIVLPPEPEPN